MPIPPGTHWSDVKPLVLPGEHVGPALPDGSDVRQSRTYGKKSKTVEPPKVIRRNGLIFDIPQPGEVLPEMKLAKAKPPKPPRVKRSTDPHLAAAARELRDRWLEQVNDLPMIGQGKYEVFRAIEAKKPATALLPDAA